MTEMSMNKFQEALLLITNPIRSRIPSILAAVIPQVEKKLYIFFPNLVGQTVDVEQEKKRIRPMLHVIYAQLSSTKDPSVDILLHNVVAKREPTDPIQLSNVNQVGFADCSLARLSAYRIPFPGLNKIVELSSIDEKDTKEQQSDDIQPVSSDSDLFKNDSTSKYSWGVLGGTFDRLHNGHKLLLSESALLCDEKIVVGITDGIMIQNKILTEFIEPIDMRKMNVISFVNSIRPDIEVYCERIEDPCGPSVTIENLKCIIVTEETKGGAAQINKERKENHLSQLDVHVVPMISADDNNQDGDKKLSSTTLRREILSICLQPPLKLAEPNRPYIIGLTGGIGSGKSSIARRMEKLGAGIVDCDKLGHETYRTGTDAYKKLIDIFGEGIVNPTDQSIDRGILGKIVFQSTDELKKLTDIVWPAILELAQARIDQLFNEGKQIIVLDAAVLIEAKWTAAVNEVWVASIPPKEAIRRIVERDHKSTVEAQNRLSAQMSNTERFQHANVVLCTYWAESVTQKQVEHAWQLLLKRIK